MSDPIVENEPVLAEEDTEEPITENGAVASSSTSGNNNKDLKDTETATAVSEGSASAEKRQQQSPSSGPIVSASKKTRPPYKFDPSKITLRFLFANRDGLTVTIECNPSDTVGEVKGSLLSVWPDGLPQCSGGDQLRLVCMGKGYLMPDSRTLEECEIPVFKTHPTPINVSVRPEEKKKEEETKAIKKKESIGQATNRAGASRPGQGSDNPTDATRVSQGCSCIIL